MRIGRRPKWRHSLRACRAVLRHGRGRRRPAPVGREHRRFRGRRHVDQAQAHGRRRRQLRRPVRRPGPGRARRHLHRPRRASTRGSSSATTRRPSSAASSSATPSPTGRCAPTSGGACRAHPSRCCSGSGGGGWRPARRDRHLLLQQRHRRGHPLRDLRALAHRRARREGLHAGRDQLRKLRPAGEAHPGRRADRRRDRGRQGHLRALRLQPRRAVRHRPGRGGRQLHPARRGARDGPRLRHL